LADPILTVLTCLVIGIADGDTLTARCETPAGPQNVNVRLAEIDAPESRQAFGNRSRQHLAALCFRKKAELTLQDTDRYGRSVARVRCEGVDANAAQVAAEMAWAFTRYLRDPSIAAHERNARIQRAGLWSDPHAIAPWEWRQRRRNAGQDQPEP
jgi:endonuclease YncB( thermonuclease family)